MVKSWKIALSALVFALAGVAVSAGTITGSAGYRERIALPPEAVLDVTLEDISLADAPAKVLSQMRYALTGVPLEFSLDYDDALIRDSMTYAVRATISLNGRLLFTTDTVHPVLTRGAGTEVDLTLVKVAASEKKAGFEGTVWQAVELRGEKITTDKLPELGFQDGGFGAYAGCNRFRGGVEIGDGTMTFSQNAAATLMACPPPYDVAEREFIETLMQVKGFRMGVEMLELTDAEGSMLLRLVPKH